MVKIHLYRKREKVRKDCVNTKMGCAGEKYTSQVCSSSSYQNIILNFSWLFKNTIFNKWKQKFATYSNSVMEYTEKGVECSYFKDEFSLWKPIINLTLPSPDLTSTLGLYLSSSLNIYM